MDYLFVQLAEDSKRPAKAFGGWPIDPEHPHIHDRDHVRESEWPYWAIVGSTDANLLVIDVDYYKMDDDQRDHIDDSWSGFLDQTRIVRTKSGGLHVYFAYNGNINAMDSIANVDLKGDIANGYALAPTNPGYSIVNDVDPAQITRDELIDLPVMHEIQQKGGIFEDIADIEKPCIRQARKRPHDDDANWLISKIETVVEGGVYTLLAESKYPGDSREAAPTWMHASPSDTQSNFMVDDGGETWRCWRHDITGNLLHLIGIKHDVISCNTIARNQITTDVWAEIYDIAEDRGYVESSERLTCDDVQDRGLCPYPCGGPWPGA